MRPTSSLSRRCVLLIAIMSPALLGSQFKCVAVSSPSVATARIERLDPISPRVGDIHRVSNALANEASISIHVYGANIGAVKRHVFDPETGRPREFVSGYSSAVLPNIWDRSAEP